VGEPTELPSADPVGEGNSATQLGILLQASVILIDEQNRVTERLESKARHQMTIAATFFAAVQAGVISLVGGALGPTGSGGASPVVPYLMVTASVAVVALAIAVLASYRTWRLRPARVLSVKTIRDYIEFALQGRSGVSANIVWAYTNVVEARQEQNDARSISLERASWACALTFVVVAVELMLAFAAVVAR
jgi:hypothetical protein